MADLPRMTGRQFCRAKRLIRRLCANYDNGNCLPLDDGEPCTCPQFITPVLICKYFRAAVLPADRELCAEVLDSIHGWKRCALCGELFHAKGSRALYCEPCAQKERRRKPCDRVRRHRGRL